MSTSISASTWYHFILEDYTDNELKTLENVMMVKQMGAILEQFLSAKTAKNKTLLFNRLVENVLKRSRMFIAQNAATISQNDITELTEFLQAIASGQERAKPIIVQRIINLKPSAPTPVVVDLTDSPPAAVKQTVASPPILPDYMFSCEFNTDGVKHTIAQRALFVAGLNFMEAHLTQLSQPEQLASQFAKSYILVDTTYPVSELERFFLGLIDCFMILFAGDMQTLAESMPDIKTFFATLATVETQELMDTSEKMVIESIDSTVENVMGQMASDEQIATPEDIQNAVDETAVEAVQQSMDSNNMSLPDEITNNLMNSISNSTLTALPAINEENKEQIKELMASTIVPAVKQSINRTAIQSTQTSPPPSKRLKKMTVETQAEMTVAPASVLSPETLAELQRFGVAVSSEVGADVNALVVGMLKRMNELQLQLRQEFKNKELELKSQISQISGDLKELRQTRKDLDEQISKQTKIIDTAKTQIQQLENDLRNEKENTSKLREKEDKIAFLTDELVKQKALLEDTQRQREDARAELQNVIKTGKEVAATQSKKRKQKECYTNRDNYANMTDDQIAEDLQCDMDESCRISDRNQSGTCVPNSDALASDEIAKNLVFKNNKSVRVIGKPQDIDYIYNNFIARVERVERLEQLAKESVPVLPPESKKAAIPPPVIPARSVPPSATNKGSISRLQAALKQYQVPSKPLTQSASARVEYARYAPETIEKEREKALAQTYDVLANDPRMFSISQECEAILKSKK
jgi:hypothetical protein